MNIDKEEDIMVIEFIKTADLVPYANNSRTHTREQIEQVAASIREFGFTNPVLIDKDNGIIAGHARTLAAFKIGMGEVPCIRLSHLTEAQKKAYVIADNKLALNAGWDEDMLAKEIQDLVLEEFDVDLIGFTAEELDDILNIDEKTIIEDEPPGPKREAISKIGDIWVLGEHRVMCGDSTSNDDVDTLMDNAIADLVITDPPYNVDYGSKAEAINKYGYAFSDRHIKNDYMPIPQFIQFLTDTFYNMNKSLKQGGTFYIWHASITMLEFETALRNNNLKSRQQLIWNKNSIVLGRQDYQWKHEPCLYGWKDGAAHYFVDDRKQTTVFEDKTPNFKTMKKEELVDLLKEIYSDKISSTIINEDKPSSSVEHPTMKPIKLLARLIKNSSKREEAILDLFGGSGSTLIAAEQLARKCYMMELDPIYIDVIVNRYVNFKQSDKGVALIRDGKQYTYKEVFNGPVA